MQKRFFQQHPEDLQFRMEMLNKGEICFMQDIDVSTEQTSAFLARTHTLSSFILKNIDKYIPRESIEEKAHAEEQNYTLKN